MDTWEILDAVEEENLERVRQILEADPNLVDAADPYHGRTPLICAAISGPEELVEYLLAEGANLEATTLSGLTPLMAAVVNKRQSLTEKLIEKGANLHAIEGSGASVLQLAADGGDAGIVGLLVSKGLDVNHQKNDGWTPLHTAAFKGHLEVCKVLIANGASMDAETAEGLSPKRAAEVGYKRDVVKYFDELIGAPAESDQVEVTVENKTMEEKARWWQIWK